MRRKRNARISRAKRSARGQEPDPAPQPEGLHALRSLKEQKAGIAPVPLPKPFFTLDGKGQTPQSGGTPPPPDAKR